MMTYDTWFALTDTTKFPNKSGVYIIRNRLNGMEYVGISASIARRLTVHRCGKSTNSRIHRAINLYGKSNFEVAYRCVPLEDLNALEKELIAARHTMSPNGYNLTYGGEGKSGWVQPQSTKDKISKANTGKRHTEATKQYLSEVYKISRAGRPPFRHSQETKARMKELRNKRNPVSEETRKNMSLAHLGKKMPESVRLALRTANAGREMPPSVKLALIAATKGVPQTESAKKKLSEAMVGKPYTEETKAKADATRAARAAPGVSNCVFVWEQESSIARVFCNFKDAATYLGAREGTLREWCRIGAPKYLKLAVIREYL